MPEPKYVLAMGAAPQAEGRSKRLLTSSAGSTSSCRSCLCARLPAHAQALLYGFISLSKKLDGQSLGNRNCMPWYSRGPSDAVPFPFLAPDIIEPRQLHMI
jgi:hypothetical protein